MDPRAEWLEADGSGGFASGTLGLVRTRRYHALLLAAMRPPSGRMVLVNGIEAWVETPGGRVALSSAEYVPGVQYPDGTSRIAAFTDAPWPCWTFRLPDGGEVTQEILCDPASGDTVLCWRGTGAATLSVRPLISGRDYHALHRENPDFDFACAIRFGNAWLRPYAGGPAVGLLSNGRFRAEPVWFRQFLYRDEAARGLDAVEDLASPGVFEMTLGEAPAILVLRVGNAVAPETAGYAARIMAAERARRAGSERAAQAFLVRRGEGHSVIAGYPWFTDWGRDTFIAMRGLLGATGRWREAESVLLAWSGLVSDGMLPNRFADDGPAEYNTADASLWFIVSVYEVLARGEVAAPARRRLQEALDAIIAGHIAGTRYGIGADADGLLHAGEAGTQLTWMDARADGVAVTPRVGKPVEIQALWFNALSIAAAWNGDMRARAARAREAFAARFADPTRGGLYDVVDADGRTGACDASLRPNQIFAVGGLPFALLEGEAARRVVAEVEQELLTPMGLRTLARGDARYAPRYEGGPAARDRAYHQGTVWPWLIGPFVEAWLRVGGSKAAARARFLGGLAAYRAGPGLGHLPEIADGEAPHAARGCPQQAWSLGEFLRAMAMTETEQNHG